MLLNLLSKITLVVLFVACIGFSRAIAQDSKTPFTIKGVYWFDTDSETEVYLFPYKNLNYRLTVVSKKDVKVTYHTSINSYESVDKELTAKDTSGAIRHFEFEHHFSKMTIWMSLEFTIDGKKIPALTRTFYDNIFETVENEKFFNPLKKKTN